MSGTSLLAREIAEIVAERLNNAAKKKRAPATVWNLKFVKKPPTDHRTNRPAPEDLPALRRYQGVTGLMRKHGITEEEAMERYDKPRGVCHVCGAWAPGRSRICDEHKRLAHLAALEKRKAEGRHLKKKTCIFDGCTAEFMGSTRKVYCNLHGRSTRPRKYKTRAAKVVAPKKVKVVVDKKKLPKNWDKPLADHLKFGPPPKIDPVIVPAGFQVKRYDRFGKETTNPNQFSPGLRDFAMGRSAVD